MSKHSVPCPKCQTPLSFTFEEAVYTNLSTVTVITVEHTKATCRNCGRDWAAVCSVPAVACTRLEEIPSKSDILIASGTMPLPSPPGKA